MRYEYNMSITQHFPLVSIEYEFETKEKVKFNNFY